MEAGKDFLSRKTKAAHNLCSPFPFALFIPQTGIIPCIFTGQRQAKHLLICESQPHSETLMKAEFPADWVSKHKYIFECN